VEIDYRKDLPLDLSTLQLQLYVYVYVAVAAKLLLAERADAYSCVPYELSKRFLSKRLDWVVPLSTTQSSFLTMPLALCGVGVL
jgi:hypothetical protein